MQPASRRAGEGAARGRRRHACASAASSALDGLRFAIDDGADLRTHRSQRRRQDHVLQRRQPDLPAHQRAASASPATTCSRSRRTASPTVGITRTFQNLALFGGPVGARERHGRRPLPDPGGFLSAALRSPPGRRRSAGARAGRAELLERLGLGARRRPPGRRPAVRHAQARRARAGARRRTEAPPARRARRAGSPTARSTSSGGDPATCATASTSPSLLVEHHMDMVMSISDKVVVIDFGSKIADGTAGRGAARPGGHRGVPGGSDA